jgi:hypothetical protein
LKFKDALGFAFCDEEAAARRSRREAAGLAPQPQRARPSSQPRGAARRRVVLRMRAAAGD